MAVDTEVAVVTLLDLPIELLCSVLDTLFGCASSHNFESICDAASTCRLLHTAAADNALWERIAVRCGAYSWSLLRMGVVLPMGSDPHPPGMWRAEVLRARSMAFGLLEAATDAASTMASAAAEVMPSTSARCGPTVVTSASRYTATPGLKRSEYCTAVQGASRLLVEPKPAAESDANKERRADWAAELAWSFLSDWLRSRLPTREPLRALVLADALSSCNSSAGEAIRLRWASQVRMRPGTLERSVELHVYSFSEKRDCRGFRGRDDCTTLSASVGELLHQPSHPIWRTLARGLGMEITGLVLRCE